MVPALSAATTASGDLSWPPIFITVMVSPTVADSGCRAQLRTGRDDNDSFVTFQVPQNCQCQQSPGLHRQQGCQAGVHRSWGWDKTNLAEKIILNNNFAHCRNCWRQCEDDSWYDLDHHLEVRMLVTAVLFLSIFCQRQVVNFTANYIFHLLLCSIHIHNPLLLLIVFRAYWPILTPIRCSGSPSRTSRWRRWLPRKVSCSGVRGRQLPTRMSTSRTSTSAGEMVRLIRIVYFIN